MKFFKSLLLAVACMFFVVACEKEYSFEEGTGSSGIGSLKSDQFGDCLQSSVKGVYKADSTLGAGNYIDVQVDVTTPGSYSVTSDTLNGYAFKGTGAFITVGLNTIRLQGAGKPLNAGTNDFAVSLNGSQCFISVTVIGSSATVGAFTLGGAPGSCTGATASGTYKQGVPLTASNTLTVNVTATSLGAYSLTATSANGMTFTKAGIFSTLGAQSVVLVGSGTPTTSGATTITVNNAAGNCTFSIPVAAGTGNTAVYTLGATAGTCTGAVTAGTYQAGIATTAANTATINVNVTTIGTYNITSTTVNGLTFSKAGTFTATGAQTVVLNATGTPTAAGPFNYPTTGGTSTCSFSVTAAPGTTPTNFILATIDGVATNFNVNIDATLDKTTSVGTEILDISGETTAGADPFLNFGIAKLGTITASATPYNVNSAAAGVFVAAYYYDVNSNEYLIETMVTPQTPGFSITITSITAARVTGTFSGTVKSAAGATKTITNGSFSVPL